VDHTAESEFLDRVIAALRACPIQRIAAELSQACSRETLTESLRKIGSKTVAITV